MSGSGDADGLSDSTRVALEELLLTLADDEFVLGFWDSEWTGIAPQLEEDVAMSSLATDELGHARAFYELLGALTGRDPDAIAYDRGPEDFRHARILDHPRTDWAFSVARRWLYDTADAVRLEALVASSYAPLAGLVAKIQREERYHLMHADAWLRRLAHADGEPRDRLIAALATLRGDATSVFAPLDGRRHSSRRGSSARRWPISGPRGWTGRGDPSRARPAAAGRRGADRSVSPRPLRGVPLAVGRVHVGPPPGPGSDVVIAAVARNARRRMPT